MAEIKDKVYINGQWIDDYYLTSEKNQELKDLRKDLTQETQNREDSDTRLINNINSIKNETNTKLNAAITSVKEDIKTATSTLQSSIDTETSRSQEKENQLEQSISKEEKRANQKEKELVSQIKDLETNVSNTYETKADALTKKSELENTINDTKTSLQQEIKDSINAVMGENVDEAYNTLKEISDWIINDEAGVGALTSRISDIEKKNGEQDTSISNLQSEDKRIEGKVDTNAKSIESLKSTLSALDPDSGGVQQLVDKVEEHSTDIESLKEKDKTLETKFDSYTTTTDLENQYVKKEADKQLSTNDYTTEEKEKLAALDSTLYEKVANKSQTVDEDTTKYPSNKAVKDYVDNNRTSVDLSNYVVKEGEPQLVNATTSFTNLVVQENKEDSPKSVNLNIDEEGYLNLGSKIRINSTREEQGFIHYGDINYTIYNGQDNLSENQDSLITTVSAVLKLIDLNAKPSGEGQNIESILCSYSIIADTLNNLKSNIDSYINDLVDTQWNALPPETQKNQTKDALTKTVKQSLTMFVLEDNSNYKYDSDLTSIVKDDSVQVVPQFIYSSIYMTTTTIKGLRLYGLDVKDSDMTYLAIYPITESYSKTESDNRYVAKSGYVAYSQAEKDKLSTIESGAQKNPTSLKNPNKLTITVNGNATEYDGSEVKNVSITIPAATTVENNLTSSSTTNALSANQGKALNDLITNLTSKITTLEEKLNQLSGE